MSKIPTFLSDRIAESLYAELHYQAWARKILKSKVEKKQINADSVKSVLFIKQNRNFKN